MKINTDIVLLTDLYRLNSDSTRYLTNVPFLVPDSTWDHIFLQLPWRFTLLQLGYFVFCDLDISEKYWPVSLYSVPYFEFVCCFLIIKFRSCKSNVPSQGVLLGSICCWYVSLLVMLTFIFWLRWRLLGFSIVKLLFFCFVVKCLLKWYFETVDTLMILPARVINVVVAKRWFFSFILSTFISWNFTVRKRCPPLPVFSYSWILILLYIL